MLPYVSKRLSNIKPIFSPSDEESNITDSQTDIQNDITYPYISYSLHDYLKKLKDSIDNNQKDWDIYKRYTNPYESIHTHNINSDCSPVCQVKPISRSYFKMIEICNTFDLLKNMPENMNSFHLAEGPGGFIEALAYLRKNPEDNYVGMTLLSDNMNVPGWRKSRIFLEKNPNVYIEEGADGTGDITKEENLLHCCGKYGGKMDLITADGGFDFTTDYNTQESQMGILLISQLAFASGIQKKGGIFIMKMFDIFTKLSLDILYILSMMYEKVHIIKPNTSRYANSERYVVAQGFRSENGRRDWTLSFALLFDKMKERNIVSLLDIDIPRYFISKIEESNSSIGQQQMDTISNTLSLIKIPRQDKIEKLRINNIQKCVLWCQKHNMPYNRDIRNFNMFLSAKNKVSRAPRKFSFSRNNTNNTDNTNNTNNTNNISPLLESIIDTVDNERVDNERVDNSDNDIGEIKLYKV